MKYLKLFESFGSKLYHGNRKGDFPPQKKRFAGAIFLTSNLDFAKDFAGMNDGNEFPNGAVWEVELKEGLKLCNAKERKVMIDLDLKGTKLSPYFKLIYKDFDLLNYKEEEGGEIEPHFFLPIIPTVLINGGSGIAVGYATNIPPHNLRELATVCEAYIKNNDITADEILKLMPGPDFPTGGKLLGQDTVLEYVS